MELTPVPTSGVFASGVFKNIEPTKRFNGSVNNKTNKKNNIDKVESLSSNSNKNKTQQGVKQKNGSSSSGKVKPNPKPAKRQPEESKAELQAADDKEPATGRACPRVELFPTDRVYNPLGILNSHRFCSFNALIQAFMVTPTIYELLQKCKGPDHPASQALWTFLIKFWISETLSRQQREQNVINPFDLEDVSSFMRNQTLSADDVEDPVDYFNFLVTSLHQECAESGSGGAAAVQNLFQGTYADGETFFSLVLNISGKDNNSLKTALQRHLNPDSRDGNATSRRFLTLPQVLCITLNRTVFNKQKGTVERYDKKIEYGSNLFIKPSMMEPKGPEARYSLFAVIKHSGYVATDGHYIAFLKHPQLRSWHCLSDDVEKTVDLQQVLLDSILDTSYMLLYSRARDTKGGKGTKTL